nr:adenylyl-sulfate kinase [Propionicimonas sp.]
MTRDPLIEDVDWAGLAGLPALTAEAVDLDIVELVQRGLIAPELRLTHGVLAAVGSAQAVVVRDVETTPLLLGTLRAGLLAVRTLRPVVTTEPVETGPADLAVIVRGRPSAADLVRVDALTTPRADVVWIVLASRTRAGRRLLAETTDLVGRRAHGRHQVVRVPWPARHDRGAFEWPQLPSSAELARFHGAKHFVVVGDAAGPDRAGRPHRGGTVVFFTGLSGSGKSTIAKALHDDLEQRTDREITLLDGDDVRRLLSAGLGFDEAGRAANVRRVSWVAALLAGHGGIAITALIAPFAAGRAEARRMAERRADFLEVWVSTPLEECERRDRKGLYAQARAGRIPDFTGIDSPYEQPRDADLVIDTTRTGVDEAVELVVAELEARAARRGQGLAPARTRREGGRDAEVVVGYDI